MSYESEKHKQDVTRNGWHVREVYFEEGEPTMHRDPHKREWVGLTDEQIDALELPPSGTATVRELVRIIEAKLKELNA